MAVADADGMRRAIVLTLLALGACGGATTPGLFDDHHADGGASGDGGDKPDGGAGSIEGSFDLAFTNVTISSSNPRPPSGAPQPSAGAKARVDIHKSGAGYEAVVTPRWGTPSAFAVAVDDAHVTLTGQTQLTAGGLGASTTDAWTRIVLATSGGRLSGTFAAVGTENVFEGDVGWNVTISGSGTIAVDTTAPETRNGSASSGPGSALLPWDPVVVDLAEPIVLSGVPVRLTAGASSFPVSWSFDAPTKDAEWVGSTRVSGLLGTWDVSKATLAASPLTDRVGLSSAATTTPIGFITVPHHPGTHGFDDDTPMIATWGQSVAFYGGFTGSDPRCENGGCVALGPWQSATCGAPNVGIAGRIDGGAVASSIVVRYRVLLRTRSGYNGTPFVYGPAVYVDAATPNLPASGTALNVSASDITKLATPIDGMTHATGWMTLTAQAPAPSTTLGFSIRAAAWGCGGPAPAPVDVELLVDSVGAK